MAKPGDWIRYWRSDRFNISLVEYTEQDGNDVDHMHYYTTEGVVHDYEVLETRNAKNL